MPNLPWWISLQCLLCSFLGIGKVTLYLASPSLWTHILLPAASSLLAEGYWRRRVEKQKNRLWSFPASLLGSYQIWVEAIGTQCQTERAPWRPWQYMGLPGPRDRCSCITFLLLGISDTTDSLWRLQRLLATWSQVTQSLCPESLGVLWVRDNTCLIGTAVKNKMR